MSKDNNNWWFINTILLIIILIILLSRCNKNNIYEDKIYNVDLNKNGEYILGDKWLSVDKM